MNKAILMGRLTRDPELRTTANNIPVCSFTVAVDRRYKSASGERQADFISVVAWRQQAELVAQYFAKGSRILLVGSIQTRTWDDSEGKRHYVTEVVADEIYFVDTKKSESGYGNQPVSQLPEKNAANDGFFPGPDDDTALPFDI
ncbi:MAG: single-stranded DNA-binding protein [Saccharofermentanales bacterium]|jgi:single-strand DNA-binding protein|nr:single-stranded DNA-binding protein [Clostridiaceae bacterium]